MAVREAKSLARNARPIMVMPGKDGPTLKKPSFDWKSPDMYHELCNLNKITRRECKNKSL